jgi:hypothetical protein
MARSYTQELFKSKGRTIEMKHQLTITEKAYRTIVNFIEGKSDFGMYRLGHVLYVVCHGHVTGEIQIGGAMYTLKEFLQLLIKNGLTKEDAKRVNIISCYGGFQDYETIDNITIGPLFPYRGMLDLNVRVDLDYNYSIIIEEYKSKIRTVS